MPAESTDTICTQGPPILAQLFRLSFHRMYALLSSSGLYPGQHHLLAQLGRRDGQNQAELAALLLIKPSTITVMIRRMTRSGFVERRLDSKDKRVYRIFLTEKGQQILQQANIHLKQIEEETFADFSPQEREQFQQFAQRMKNNLLQASKGETQPCPWF